MSQKRFYLLQLSLSRTEGQRPGTLVRKIVIHVRTVNILIFALIWFCRYYGRKILHIVYDHPEFDKLVSKHVPSNLLKDVRDTVENLRTKVGSNYFVLSRNILFLLRDEWHE